MKLHQNKSVAAITLGCKLNYAESSAILDNLCKLGWILSTGDGEADLLIIHTCAVTQQAEKKCRQKIRSLIRKNPGSRIAVIGCYSQLHPETLSKIDGVDAILGSNDKFDSRWYNHIFQKETSTPLVKVTPADSNTAICQGYSLPAHASQDRTRAFLKIQDGCDYGCSYCTIPLIRGRSRSIPSAEIVERATLLASSGYREIILTGINTGDYRHDNMRLCALLRQLEKIDISRIRISSIEPDIVDHELISLVAGSKKIVPHLHIPLQSGSDTILRAMRRRYDTSHYRNKVVLAVERIAECAIGADVMVGYPGETEEDFLTMYRFLEELPLAYLHLFSCSVRPGTHLARQIEKHECKPLPSEEITRRYRELVELGYQKERKFKLPSVGNVCTVLFENSRPQKKGGYQCSGYTPNYQRVIVESLDRNRIQSLTGNEHPVLIESIDEDLNLKGRVLS
ncbi:MAG: MiaB/RimO family radical SAM methylthiotransferase [Chlorobium sp.]